MIYKVTYNKREDEFDNLGDAIAFVNSLAMQRIEYTIELVIRLV